MGYRPQSSERRAQSSWPGLRAQVRAAGRSIGMGSAARLVHRAGTKKDRRGGPFSFFYSKFRISDSASKAANFVGSEGRVSDLE